jgi:ubiquinone biosynthesis accessory factor UbiK
MRTDSLAHHFVHHLHASSCCLEKLLGWVNFATLTGITYIRRVIMLNAKVFVDISAKISEAANSGPARDIERNVRALLAQGFAKLDLVTREEFDVQAQVLARTREKLAALEARVTELEAQRNTAAR